MKKQIVLLGILFLLLAIPAAVWQLADGVMVDGQFFTRRSPDLYLHGKDSVTITRTDAGANIMIQLNGEQLEAQVSVEDNAYTFRYMDGRVVSGYWGEWLDVLVTADGKPLEWEDGIQIIVNNEQPQSILKREYSLSNVLCCMLVEQTEQRGHPVLIMGSLLLYALGVITFFWPEEVYFFGGRWRYAHAELSPEGIAVQKLGGVVCAIVGIGLLYAPMIW